MQVKLDAFARKPVANHEFGLLGGFSYYTGDLNPEGHLNTQFYHLGFGAYYRKNYNPRVSMRYMLLRGRLSGADSYFDNVYQQKRNLDFTTSVTELSSLIEFNFFRFSAVKERSMPITPFAFIGLGGFYFSPERTVKGTTLDLQAQSAEGVKYSKINVAIPFGMGVKFRYTDRLFMSLEYGMRKTFTDYIDDVSTIYPKNFYQRGDSKSNDWYQYIGLTLSFRIGPKITDCYFD